MPGPRTPPATLTAGGSPPGIRIDRQAFFRDTVPWDRHERAISDHAEVYKRRFVGICITTSVVRHAAE